MKNYLTGQELNDLLFTTYLIERNRDTVKEWESRGNLTKEEAKYLRTAVTYTEKSLALIINRMPEKQIEKFMLRTLRAVKDPVRIVDKWTYDRLLGSMEKEYEIVKMPRVEFEYLAMTLIDKYCRECKKTFDNCDLYTLLDNNLFPTCDSGPNCPYQFIPPEVKEAKKQAKLEKMENKKSGKISKRKLKKIAARFDD